jgi:hypothetical protein
VGVAVGYIVGGQTLGLFVDIDKVNPNSYVVFYIVDGFLFLLLNLNL